MQIGLNYIFERDGKVICKKTTSNECVLSSPVETCRNYFGCLGICENTC